MYASITKGTRNIIMAKARLTMIIVYNTIIIVNISCILFSILFSDTPDKPFKEAEFITWLSCVNLVMLSGISLCSLFVISFFETCVSNRQGQFVFVLLCFLGFLFLGVDEWFQVHEKLDFWFHKVLNIEETSLTDRLDDLFVMIYGVSGVALFYIFCKKFWFDKNIKSWLLITISLFTIMVLLDMAGNDTYLYRYITDKTYLYNDISIVLGIIEDSIKVIAETSLIIAFLEIFQSLLKVLKLENAKTDV